MQAGPVARQRLTGFNPIGFSHHSSEQNDVTKPLARYCSSLKLVSMKNIGLEDLTESNYHITLKSTKKTEEMVRNLRETPGVQQVNVFFDEDDFNPPTM